MSQNYLKLIVAIIYNNNNNSEFGKIQKQTSKPKALHI